MIVSLAVPFPRQTKGKETLNGQGKRNRKPATGKERTLDCPHRRKRAAFESLYGNEEPGQGGGVLKPLSRPNGAWGDETPARRGVAPL